MPFTLLHLTTLVRVATLGNFTRAAASLYLTQPAVTQQIHALERQVGVPLIEVIGHQPVLTDAGRFLVARAEDLLLQTEAVERDMRAFVAAEQGELRLGATLTIGTYLVPDLLAHWCRAHPQAVVQVTIANTAQIADQVRSGLVGMALVEGTVASDDFDLRPFQTDELVLVAPPTHPLTRLATVTLADLAAVPLVLREPGSGTRAQVEAALAAAGIVPRMALALPSGEGVLRAVAAGLGVTFTSRLAAQDAVTTGRLVIVPVAQWEARRHFQAITRRGRVRAPLVASLLASLPVVGE